MESRHALSSATSKHSPGNSSCVRSTDFPTKPNVSQDESMGYFYETPAKYYEAKAVLVDGKEIPVLILLNMMCLKR